MCFLCDYLQPSWAAAWMARVPQALPPSLAAAPPLAVPRPQCHRAWTACVASSLSPLRRCSPATWSTWPPSLVSNPLHLWTPPSLSVPWRPLIKCQSQVRLHLISLSDMGNILFCVFLRENGNPILVNIYCARQAVFTLWGWIMWIAPCWVLRVRGKSISGWFGNNMFLWCRWYGEGLLLNFFLTLGLFFREYICNFENRLN